MKTVVKVSSVLSSLLRTPTFSTGFHSSSWKKNDSIVFLFTITIYVVSFCLCIVISHAYPICSSHIPDCKVRDKFELVVDTPSLSSLQNEKFETVIP